MNPALIIKERFGIHRGLESPYAPPNSLNAIKSAIDLNPLFIEFDVIYYNGKALTSHPPQIPLDDLHDVIYLFKNRKTFPKIDLKFDSQTYLQLIDIVINILKDFKSYTLVNISGVKDRELIFKIEEYFAYKCKDMPYVKINIDPARYRHIRANPKEMIDKDTLEHLEKIKYSIDAMSIEIHEEDWNYMIELAKKLDIKNIYFWLRGWPDIKHPVIHIETIYKALELENKYNINVFFDINMNYIKDLNHILVLYDTEGRKVEKYPFLYYG